MTPFTLFKYRSSSSKHCVRTYSCTYIQLESMPTQDKQAGRHSSTSMYLSVIHGYQYMSSQLAKAMIVASQFFFSDGEKIDEKWDLINHEVGRTPTFIQTAIEIVHALEFKVREQNVFPYVHSTFWASCLTCFVIDFSSSIRFLGYIVIFQSSFSNRSNFNELSKIKCM